MESIRDIPSRMRPNEVGGVHNSTNRFGHNGGLTEWFIIDDGVNVIYYQAKSTPGAFKSLTNVQNWVAKAEFDAYANGITNQVIRYVTPNPANVAGDIAAWLSGRGILIDTSPLLR